VAALVMTAVGLTVTERLKGVPAQPFLDGVITYTATFVEVVVLISD
jgi:hypothetical protein